MKTTIIASILLCLLIAVPAKGQDVPPSSGDPGEHLFSSRRFSVSTSYLSLMNFGEEKTNTHHYEVHIKYHLTPKDKIGIKAATWKLFAPMGIQFWEPEFLQEGSFFPGRLRESGIGVSYQRLLCGGLFASVEVLPLYKTYLDEGNNIVGHGFKLYTTAHLGYHFFLLDGAMFIEPQVHCNYWPIDTNVPPAFKEAENRRGNIFLFEPNIYLGFNL